MNPGRSIAFHAAGKRDMILFALVVILGLSGLLILYPASSILSQMEQGDPEYYFYRQTLWFVIGIAGMFLFAFFPFGILRKFAIPMMAGVILLLVLVYVPGIGKSVSSDHESFHRWITVGPVTFQPSEFAKIAIIVYVSSVFSKGNALPESFNLRRFIPPLIFVSLPLAAIVIEPQYGTTVCIISVIMVMTYLAGFPVLRLLALMIASMPVFFLVAILYRYRLERFRVWLDPYSYRYEGGYQLVTSFRAFRDGGIFGEEFASGFAHRYLTYGHTDFILALFSENHGLLGIVILFALYIAVLWRSVFVLRKINDTFVFMTASGSVIMIITQALLNMFVVVGLVPTTGVSLPFISYGGSSLIVTLAFCGIILNASSRRSDDASEGSLSGTSSVEAPGIT